MLKEIILNKRKVPVPVPVKTVREAISWVEGVLVVKDHSITKIELDGKIIDLSNAQVGKLGDLPLEEGSKMVFQIDSPSELSIQTIDALRNLTVALGKNLKPIAVACWQTLPKDTPDDLNMVQKDVDLALDLLDHLLAMIDQKVSRTHIDEIAHAIGKARLTLQMAISNSDWKGSARILLNHLDPWLSALNDELSSIQKMIFELQADAIQDKKRKNVAKFISK